MARVKAWLRRFISKHWLEGVVLAIIIGLDHAGWLPQLVVDISEAPEGGGYSATTRGICLLVFLTVAWALIDELTSNSDQANNNSDVRQSA